jgi:hypothetical protein
MGDKHQNKSKHGKKPTKKEVKAQNHLKLMQNKQQSTGNTSNVVDINAFKDKKAA